MQSHKWWHVVYFGLFDVTTVRLEVLATRFKMCTDRRDLLTKLQAELLENQFDSPVGHCTRAAAQQSDGAIPLASRTRGKHPHVKRTQIKNGNEVRKQGPCVVCQADNFGVYVYEKRTKDGPQVRVKKPAPKPAMWCPICKVHLCIGDCFQRFHSSMIEHYDYGPRKCYD